MTGDDFPICDLWLGMIEACTRIADVDLAACTGGHLNPPDRTNAARCPIPGCGAYSRTLTLSEAQELGTVAALGNAPAARAHCTQLATKPK